MYRKHCKCADILLIDLSAGPKSRKDHFVKFLPGQVADGIIIQLHCAGPFGTAGYPVHIFAADGSDGLQRIDHTVYRCHTDLRVQCGSPVINFLTAGALPFQNDIKQDPPLSGNS